jgi:hypothetical protein
MALRRLLSITVAVAACAAGPLAATPANAAALGACAAVSPGAPSCSYTSGGGDVLMNCLAAFCSVTFGASSVSCGFCTGNVGPVFPGTRVTLRITGTGTGTVSDNA